MVALKVIRLIFLVSLVLLSGVVLGSSSFFNSRTTPTFHFQQFVFPFVWSIISFLILSTVIAMSNKRFNKLSSSSIIVELPIMVILLVIWFVCADRGTNDFFGPFRHCDRGKGVGVMSAGLDVPSHCKTIAVLHGCEWLSVIFLLLFCGVTALAGLFALYRQGWKALSLGLNDLKMNGHPLVQQKTF